ncbi:MAG: hypothetical protein V5A72_00160 [Candidatus Nanohaloarchaea archaeon]
MKGQSAVEYLSTYAWMILAVSLVAGVAFANVRVSCNQSFSDFYTDAVEVSNFGLDGSGDLVMSVENTKYQDVEFESINVTIGDDFEDEKPLNLNLSSGEKGQINIAGFKSTSSCNSLDIEMVFDIGDLDDQRVTGVVRAPIGFN